MNYRNVADLGQTLARNMRRLPQDIDLIVGIPRSGILAGIMLALMKNIRFTDLDGLIAGRLSGVGSTKTHGGLVEKIGEVRHALVIDDSLNRGYAMQEAREKLSFLRDMVKMTFAAVYVVPDATDDVDFAFEELALPRLFEWNFSHHSYLARSCVNMDGVIWDFDPRMPGGGGTGSVRNISPLYRFTAPIGCLVTERAEDYRSETEAWLEREGIRYDRLVMKGPSVSEEVSQPFSGSFAAEIYRDSKTILFIESDIERAAGIARFAGKPVLATDRQQMVEPADFTLTTIKQRVRNARINAEIAHSPLVNREAFRRRVKRIVPERLLKLTKSMIASRRERTAD